MASNYVIFDFDGTLVDSFDHVIAIYNQICHKYNGVPILVEQQAQIKHLELTKLLLNYNISKLKLPFIILEIKAILKSQIHNLSISNDLLNVLSTLRASNYKIGIVSSNSRYNILSLLNKHNLVSNFSFIHTGSNIFGKHHVLKKVIKRYNLSLERIIYIGDEVRDIKAAKVVGVKCLVVAWGYNSKQILEHYAPGAVCSYPQQILDYCQQMVKAPKIYPPK